MTLQSFAHSFMALLVIGAGLLLTPSCEVKKKGDGWHSSTNGVMDD